MLFRKNEDRLSELPQNVIEEILIRMPIRDAVRTSILSRGWRFKWSTIQDLVFDGNSFPQKKIRNESGKYRRNVVKSVDHVLLLHQGPVRRFKFSIWLIDRGPDMNTWLLLLSRKEVQELFLSFPDGILHYKLPTHLFSCEVISYLEIHRGSFVLPTTFKGFQNLKTLILCYIRVTDKVFDRFIAHCPNLENLRLWRNYGLNSLTIRAPELVNLTIEANHAFHLCLESARLLADLEIASIGIEFHWIVRSAAPAKCELMKALPSRKRLQELKSDEHFMPFLDNTVPCGESQLKSLQINISFNNGHDIQAALSIINISPLLETLNIMVISYVPKEKPNILTNWADLDISEFLFRCLVKVKIIGFTGLFSELKFVEYLLAHSPVLETMQIELHAKVNDVVGIYRYLNSLQRCSPKAKVVLPGP